MDETEFQRMLDLFPVVRSRDYQWEFDSSRSRQSVSQSQSTADNEMREWHDAWDEMEKRPSENEGTDVNNAFWDKLKMVARRKVGPAQAEKFCQEFQKIHKKLVYEGLSLDAARSYIASSNTSSKTTY